MERNGSPLRFQFARVCKVLIIDEIEGVLMDLFYDEVLCDIPPTTLLIAYKMICQTYTYCINSYFLKNIQLII